MEKILIGSSIPVLTSKTLVDLTEGQMGILLYSHNEGEAPVLRGTELTNTELLAARGMQFIKKEGTDYDASLVIPIQNIFDKNYKAYEAPVAGVFKLGDNAADATALTIPATGEGNIGLVDLMRPYEVDNFMAQISVTKRSNETPAQYLGRVVAAINSDHVAKTLVTAALETASGRYQIKLTTLNADIKLGVTTDGIFENYKAITVTERKVGQGTYAQISAIEQELTVFKGNGNYMENGDLYFKDKLRSTPGTNYNVCSISWTAVARPTHSTTMAVANPNLLICTPSNDTTLAALFVKLTTPDPEE